MPQTRAPRRTRLGPALIALGVTLCGLAFGACGSSDQAARSAEAVDQSIRDADAKSPEPAPPAADARPRVVALGDSITAGLGLPPDQAYPALLQQRIDRDGLNYHVVNAGVSGDTTAGGLRRVDLALDGDVRVLIVALGGNDALRALPVETMRGNLAQIIEHGQRKGATVILAGMEAPPNFGRTYTVSFHQVYPELARTYKVSLVPFLLDRVAGIDDLNQRDGIHPNAEGARIVADTIWKALEPVLKRT